MDTTIAQMIVQDRRMAYAVAGRDLRVVEVGGAKELLGGGGSAWVGRSLLEMVPELIGIEPLLADILAGRLPRAELAWLNRETVAGQELYVTIVELPYRDPAGRIAGLLHAVEDVTEAGVLKQRLAHHRNELLLLHDQLARQNVELTAANTELTRLDELKSTFLSVAAHELRAPLAAIQGYIEVLLDEEPGPLAGEQREYLEIVQRGTDRLLSITGSLLDATRIEAGRMELVLRPTGLAELLASVGAEYEPRLEDNAQRLTLHAHRDLPLALCDETRAMQIFGNLLSNACKYTPHGGEIEVTVTLAEEEGFLQVAVADSGVGIDDRDQSRLFDRFFRAETAKLTDARGTGLGLYITRSLVELHGGRAWFESQSGRGSTFYVTLPIAQ
jgi:signal transduction histidine kinase